MTNSVAISAPLLVAVSSAVSSAVASVGESAAAAAAAATAAAAAAAGGSLLPSSPAAPLPLAPTPAAVASVDCLSSLAQSAASSPGPGDSSLSLSAISPDWSEPAP